MNPFKSKKMIAGGIALTLALGGGAISVFAADDSATVTPTPSVKSQEKGMKQQGIRNDNKEFRKEGKDFGNIGFQGDCLQTAADVLGMKVEDIQTGLKSGKSLADLAQEKGISADTLIAKLTEKVHVRIDEAVKAGTLTQEKADAAKQKLSERIKNMVETKGLHKFDHGRMGKGGMGHIGLDKAAAVIGISKDELSAQLKAGKSITEVAQEHGISKDQLIAKLKEEMTPMLEKFVDSKHMKDQVKEQTKDKVKK